MAEIFPSLISANLLELKEEIELLEPHVAGFHIDVMDFHFVPNLTWGPAFINQIRRATNKKLWVHLMVDSPEKYLDRLELSDNDIVSVHFESQHHGPLLDLFDNIQSRGWVPSMALNPDTSIKVLDSVGKLEPILLMSVEPGFSGQEFIPETADKLKKLAHLRKEQALPLTIALDGGINSTNAHELVSAGADQLAIASALFSDPDRLKALHKILKSIEK